MAFLADDPTYTDKMQAWGAVAGIPLSLGALIFTGLLLWLEFRSRREDLYFNAAAQARLVRVYNVAVGGETGSEEECEFSYHVRNESEKPVFDVKIHHESVDGDIFEEPSRFDSDPLMGNTERFVITKEPYRYQAPGIRVIPDPKFILTFIDSEGRPWYRIQGAGLPRPWLKRPTPTPSDLPALVSAYLELPRRLGAIKSSLPRPLRCLKRQIRQQIRKRDERRIAEGLKFAMQHHQAKNNPRNAGPKETDRPSE